MTLAAALYGFSIADIVAMALYFGAVLTIGLRAMRHVHNQEDFFLGGRRFGKVITTFANFGQATSSEHAVWMTTVVHHNGAAGIMFAIGGGLLAVPIYWFTSKWFRRLRTLTLADFFSQRYGSKRMAGLYSVVTVFYFMLLVGLALSALGKTVSAIAAKPAAELTATERVERAKAVELAKLESADLDDLSADQKARMKALRLAKPRKEFSYINPTVLVVCVALFVIVYSALGGLEAAAYSDMLQGIFIILLSVLLIPFAMMKVNAACGTSGLLGPFEAIQRKLPEAMLRIFGSGEVPEFTWYYLVSFAVMGALSSQAAANAMVAMGAARDEHSARVGCTYGIFLKRYCTVLWGFMALLTVVLYGTAVSNPDLVWGHATRDLLGPLGIGLVGLMVACMLSALMSTADTLMITSSGLLTHNLYKPLVKRRSERHYIWVGRAFSAVFLLGSMLVATAFDTLFGLVKFIVMFNAIVGASFLMGILWRRATRIGAWASMVVMLLYTLVLPVAIPWIPGVRTSEYLLKTTHPAPVRREYHASEMDVAERAENIRAWDKAAAKTPPETPRPVPLTPGQRFTKTHVLPQKSVFWREGVEVRDDGTAAGKGMLKVDLVLIDLLGWDLGRNPYALNETFTALLRILVPFGTLIVVSLLTRPDDRRRLDRFYAKMRTPVTGDKAHDEAELAAGYEQPDRLLHTRILPGSNWELARWDGRDYRGMFWIVVGIAGCVLLLWAIVTAGG